MNKKEEKKMEEKKIPIPPISEYNKKIGKKLMKLYNINKKNKTLPVFDLPNEGYLVNKHFKIYKWIFELKDHKGSDLNSIMYTFYRNYKEISKKYIISENRPNTKIQIVVGIRGNESVVSTKLVKPYKIDLKMILELVSREEHYGNAILDNLIINVKEFRGRRGAGGDLNKRKCVYGFNSKSYCGLKSLVILILHNEGKSPRNIRNLIKRNPKKLNNLSIELGKEIESKTKYILKESMSFNDFNYFCEVKKDFRVIIFNSEKDFSPYVTDKYSNNPKNIYICFDDGHYLPINNVEVFIKKHNPRRKICEFCLKIWDIRKNNKHDCLHLKCVYCESKFQTKKDLFDHSIYNPISCNKCHKYIRYGDECRKLHEKICDIDEVHCNICYDKYKIKNKHKHSCKSYVCIYCNNKVEKGHICYILPYSKPKTKIYKSYAWDIESTIDKNGYHKPSIICVKPLKEYEESNELNKPNKDDKPNKSNKSNELSKPNKSNELSKLNKDDKLSKLIKPNKSNESNELSKIIKPNKSNESNKDDIIIFKNISKFAYWCLTRKGRIKMFAHNAKGYDNILLKSCIINEIKINPKKIIMRGQKIIYMLFKNVEFLDSMNHLSGSLDSQVKTFNLNTGDKGYFPYKFYTTENKNYVGNVPDNSYFNIKDINDFNNWKSQFNDKNPYDIEKECIKYCKQDCNILAKALETYRNAAIETNELDPLNTITIAGYAQKVFLMSHYCNGDKYSEKYKFAKLPKYIDTFISKSFHGGRTEVFKLKAEGNIKYIDVSSEYPTVQKYDLLPYGDPIVFDGKLKNIKDNEIGFIDCKIYCPDIHLPVLMIKCKISGKLISPIGNIKGVFTSLELNKAISLGYKIRKIYGGIKFKAKRGIFKSYVDLYYNGKNKAKQDNNLGKAALCKMMLNSLWGKFAQKINLTKHNYISNPNEWFDMIENNTKTINNVNNSSNGIFVTWEYKDDDIWSSDLRGCKRNIALASAITSNARLRLYESMEKAGNNLCYVDTDSCIYVDDENNNISKLIGVTKEKPKLGEWELEDEISKYVAIGPKSYSYITNEGIEKTKCKGFKCDWITFDKYNKMCDDNNLYYDNETTLFKRDKK